MSLPNSTHGHHVTARGVPDAHSRRAARQCKFSVSQSADCLNMRWRHAIALAAACSRFSTDCTAQMSVPSHPQQR